MEKIQGLFQKNKQVIMMVIAVLIIILIAIFTINNTTKNLNKESVLASSEDAIGITGVVIEKSDTADATYTINDGGKSISFTATLGAVGDAVNYIISVKNTSFSPTAFIDTVDVASSENSALKYTTDADGKIIKKGTTEKINFRITYDTDADTATTSNEITIKLKFKKFGFLYGNTTILPLSKALQKSNTAGLYPDETEKGRYIYKKETANNKIVFNGEPYKILAIEKDGRIKIVKMTSIGQFRWNSNTGNNWEGASLKTYLEDTWLPTQESGEDYNHLSANNEWYVGSVIYTDYKLSISDLYAKEKQKVVNSPVGLISVSELRKMDSSVSLTGRGNNGDGYWTITPIGTDSYAMYGYSNWPGNYGGDFSGSSVSTSLTVFPVLYLKSNISLVGSGTNTDPYCIKGSNCPKNLDFTAKRLDA